MTRWPLVWLGAAGAAAALAAEWMRAPSFVLAAGLVLAAAAGVAAARRAAGTVRAPGAAVVWVVRAGARGGLLATPIVHHPQVAILGVHRIEKRPVVHEDQVAIREMMYLTCSFDHRVVDGHVGAAFVESVKEYLEHPALLFVEA